MERMSLRNLMLLGKGGGSSASFLKYAKNFSAVYKDATVPEEFVLDFGGATISDCTNAFYGSSAKKVVLKNATFAGTFSGSFRSCSNLEEVDFSESTVTPTVIGYMCRGSSKLKRIIGEIDCSSLTTDPTSFAYGCSALEEVRIKASTLSRTLASGDISDCSALSDASIISIANGLDGTATGKSIKFHATPKARLATLKGNNVDGTFIASDDGETTLDAFITDVKGWELT